MLIRENQSKISSKSFIKFLVYRSNMYFLKGRRRFDAREVSTLQMQPLSGQSYKSLAVVRSTNLPFPFSLFIHISFLLSLIESKHGKMKNAQIVNLPEQTIIQSFTKFVHEPLIHTSSAKSHSLPSLFFSSETGYNRDKVLDSVMRTTCRETCPGHGSISIIDSP